MKVPVYLIIFSLSNLLVGCFSLNGKNLKEEKKNSSSKINIAKELSGEEIRASLSQISFKKARLSEHMALEYTPAGKAVFWENRKTGEHGEVIAGQLYRVGSQDCRQFIHTLFNLKGSNLFRSTACRGSNGEWFLLP